MSRDLTSSVLTELTASTIRPFYLFEAEFISTTLRLASTPHDITWNSEAWLGNGWFLGLPSIKEVGSVDSQGIEINLCGIPDTLISLLLTDTRQNLEGNIYLGFFDANWSVISDPVLLFSGGLDVPKISDSDNDLKISISYESNFALLKKAIELRYTDQHQKNLFAGDKGFEFVNSLQDWTGFWGNKEKPKASNKKKNTTKKKSKK